MSSTLNNDILIQSDLNYDALKDSVAIPSIDLSLFPVPDFTTNPVPTPTTVTNTLLTDKNVDGTGCFDNLMTSISKHLTNEFKEGRIEQDKFGDIYSQNMIQAMSIASQYVLNSVTTNYQNQLLKKQLEQQEINNVTAKVQLEITKLNASRARYEALTANTNYAISKQQLANTNADYLLKIKQLALSDKELELKDKNILLTQEQIDTAILNQASITKNNLILDKNLLKLDEEIDLLQSEDLIKTQQIELVKQQVDTERAKTKNTTSTGATIVGVLGKEKDLKDAQMILYERQQDAYVVDSKAKVGMMFKEVYAINKSADPGTTVPSSLNDSNINEVVNAMRSAVDI
jgi:hypothetical protein